MVSHHPENRELLGMSWKSQIFVDTLLPFGLQSALKIFMAVANALQYTLLEQGVSHIMHYLDDLASYYVFGSPGIS